MTLGSNDPEVLAHEARTLLCELYETHGGRVLQMEPEKYVKMLEGREEGGYGNLA
jgi:hypothetical protein